MKAIKTETIKNALEWLCVVKNPNAVWSEKHDRNDNFEYTKNGDRYERTRINNPLIVTIREDGDEIYISNDDNFFQFLRFDSENQVFRVINTHEWKDMTNTAEAMTRITAELLGFLAKDFCKSNT